MGTSQLSVWQVANIYVKESSLNEEIRNQILGWIRSRSHAKLASLTTAATLSIASVDEARELLQIEAFFSKNPEFVVEADCVAKARETFQKAERVCRITNRRLEYYFLHPERLPSDLRLQVDTAVRWIESTLGNFGLFLDELPKRVRFTSGATSTSTRQNSKPYQKVSLRNLTVASRINAVLADSLAQHMGYPKPSCKIVPENRVLLVPKSWKTHRTIACEPVGALPFQLAFDAYAKDRLRLVGIDLSSQDYNQLLARIGSVHDSHVTIDIKTASDTVAYNTVGWLFPFKWFRYLDSLRSTRGFSKVEGFDVPCYEKFSSMGNGSTFCIETLIFAALCYASGAKFAFGVYGDDICVETVNLEALLRLLKFFGFRVNEDKTHTMGPFRESCGKNYYRGKDITPFYIRDSVRSQSGLSHVINGLRSISVPGGLLWDYLQPFTKGLLRVPYNEDSRSGLWIAPTTAYRERLIRSRKKFPYVYRYEAYTFVSEYRRDAASKKVVYEPMDSRKLFLWYLDAQRRNEDGGVLNYLEASLSRSNRTGEVLPESGVYRRRWRSYVGSVAVPHWVYSVQ